MANGSSALRVSAFKEETLTSTKVSENVGLPASADEVGLLTQIISGSASALTVKLQHKIGDIWADVTGASGNSILDSNSTSTAELNFATKPNSGLLRVNASAVTLYAAKTVPSADIANATDNFNKVGHGFITGVEVVLSTSDTVPSGLVDGDTYFIIKIDNDNFKLASSYANALLGTVIDISDDGVGNQTLTPVPLVISSEICFGSRED